jgi:voltage-gated potassium channel
MPVLLIVVISFVQVTWRTLRTDAGFRALFYLVALVLCAGTIFYWQTEHWSLFDSFYFSVITLATVGYGDLTPTRTISKAFTIVYIFVGLGTLLLFINKMAELATNRPPDNPGLVPKLRDWVQTHRHQQREESTSDHT